jgi:glycosyltransferase involved in cell wall biosynthesis
LSNSNLTIIIPTFNRANLLKRALDSIFEQNVKPSTIIISDNNSKDHTKEIVKSFKTHNIKIVYYRHQKNIGMLKNWEFSIGKVRTKYFSVLADDDYLLPNFIEKGLPQFTQNKNLGMWSGVTLIEDSKYLVPSNLKAIHKFHNLDLLDRMSEHPASTATMISREKLNAVGGFRKKSASLADLSMMLRIASKFEIKITEDQVAVYTGCSSFDTNLYFKNWLPGYIDILKQIKVVNKQKKKFKKIHSKNLSFDNKNVNY